MSRTVPFCSTTILPGLKGSGERSQSSTAQRVRSSRSESRKFLWETPAIPSGPATGLAGVVWHTLRHTFCSRRVQAGIPLTTVQKLAGHKDYSTTLIYAHLSPGHLHEAVGVLLTGQNPKKRIRTGTKSGTDWEDGIISLDWLWYWRARRDLNPRPLDS